MDNNASIESLSIEIEGTSRDAASSVNTLIESLNRLKNSLQNAINSSKNFKELKSNIGSATSRVSALKSAKATAKSSYGSINEQLMNEKLGLNIGSEDELKAVAKLKSRIVDVNGSIEKYITQNNKLVTVSKSTKDGIENVKVSVKDLAEQTQKSSGSIGKLTGFLGKGVKSLLAIAGINKSWSTLSNYVEEASAYTEAMNLYTVTMGDNAKKGLKWIKEYSDALYLDPSNVMQYMGAFNSLAKGLGVGADNSYLMSKNLTQLTYDLASFKNLDIESAFKKIQSGISGKIICLIRKGLRIVTNLIQWNSKHVMV